VVATAAARDLGRGATGPLEQVATGLVLVATQPAARLEAAPQRILRERGFLELRLRLREQLLALHFLERGVVLQARDLLVVRDLLEAQLRGPGVRAVRVLGQVALEARAHGGPVGL